MILNDVVMGTTRDETGTIQAVRWMSESLNEHGFCASTLVDGVFILNEADHSTQDRFLEFGFGECDSLEIPIAHNLLSRETLTEIADAIRRQGVIKLGSVSKDLRGQTVTAWHDVEVTVYNSRLDYYLALSEETTGDYYPPYWQKTLTA